MASMVGGSAPINMQDIENVELDDIPAQLKEFERSEESNTKQVDDLINSFVMRVINRHPVHIFKRDLLGLLEKFSKIKNVPQEIAKKKAIILDMALTIEAIRESEGFGRMRRPATQFPLPIRVTSDLEQARQMAKIAKANAKVEKLEKENQELKAEIAELRSILSQLGIAVPAKKSTEVAPT